MEGKLEISQEEEEEKNAMDTQQFSLQRERELLVVIERSKMEGKLEISQEKEEEKNAMDTSRDLTVQFPHTHTQRERERERYLCGKLGQQEEAGAMDQDWEASRDCQFTVQFSSVQFEFLFGGGVT